MGGGLQLLDNPSGENVFFYEPGFLLRVGGARQFRAGGKINANLRIEKGSHAASKPARDDSQRL